MSKATIINATPHALNFYKPDDAVSDEKRGWIAKEGATPYLTIEPSGIIPRCKKLSNEVGEINGIPIRVSEFGDIDELPESADGVIYVVSQIVQSAAQGRRDLYYPDELVRNDAGQIIGCMALGS
jgi:hypothetical protein